MELRHSSSTFTPIPAGQVRSEHIPDESVSNEREPSGRQSLFNYRSIRKLSPDNPDSRYVDIAPMSLSFTPCEPVTLEGMNNLDYRVEPQPELVAKKLKKARLAALECSKNRTAENSKAFSDNCEKDIRLLMDDADDLIACESSGPWGSCFQLENRKKHTLQDRFVFEQETYEPKNDTTCNVRYAGIFDGHGKGGETAATVASVTLAAQIMKRAVRYAEPESGLNDTVIWNAHKVGFSDCDRILGQHFQGGTTASLSSIVKKDLWTANTGDSRQVMLKPDGSYIPLTRCAFPQKPACQKQVIKRGGISAESGKALKLKNGSGTLRVAGTLGDKKYKGISNPRPKVVVTRRPDSGWNNHYLIMGSDGFWDMANDKTICKVVTKLMNRGFTKAEITKILAWSARKAGSKDDISVALVDLLYMYKRMRSGKNTNKSEMKAQTSPLPNPKGKGKGKGKVSLSSGAGVVEEKQLDAVSSHKSEKGRGTSDFTFSAPTPLIYIERSSPAGHAPEA